MTNGAESNLAGFDMRPLGRTKTMVYPVGLAGSTFGRNDPPIEVYRRGIELGMNLFFWDPMFKNMTGALLELSDEERSRLFIYGTIGFGGPKQIRKALFKRLKILKLERLSGFTLGWVRSEFRVRRSIIDEMENWKEKGYCDNIGLSAHRRKLAYKIYGKNVLDLFMLRYNAAHRGLEQDFLDRLDPDNLPTVITYTTTRWGKLLQKPPGWEGDIPRPGDLYRFSLSHPRVNAVLMSAGSTEELESNIKVLSEGPLKPDEMEFVKRFGDAVYSSQKKPIIGELFERSGRL
jgi:aryl-alcohol dehydrogenase-like predicted oxidoreductase